MNTNTITTVSVPPTEQNIAVPPTAQNIVVPPTTTEVVPPTSSSSTNVPPTFKNLVPPTKSSSTTVPPTVTRVVPPTSLSSTSVPPTETNIVPPTLLSRPTKSYRTWFARTYDKDGFTTVLKTRTNRAQIRAHVRAIKLASFIFKKPSSVVVKDKSALNKNQRKHHHPTTKPAPQRKRVKSPRTKHMFDPPLTFAYRSQDKYMQFRHPMDFTSKGGLTAELSKENESPPGSFIFGAINTWITSIISNQFPKLANRVLGLTAFVTSIVNSIVNMVHILVNSTTGFFKYAAILTNITAFATSLAALCTSVDIPFLVDQCVSSISGALGSLFGWDKTSHEVRSMSDCYATFNAECGDLLHGDLPEDAIPMVTFSTNFNNELDEAQMEMLTELTSKGAEHSQVHGFATIVLLGVFAGMYATGKESSSIRDFSIYTSATLSSMNLFKASYGSIKSLVDSFFESTALGEAAAAKLLLDEANDHLSTPTYKYFSGEAFKPALVSLPSRITKLLSKPPKSTDDCYQAFRSLTSPMSIALTNLNNKILSMNLLESDEVRPQPVGLVLSGERNVGKSRLSSYIFSRVARNLNLKSSAYSLAQGTSKHWETWRHEKFAKHDEFLMIKDDPMIKTMNTLLSPSRFCLPGADINDKKQYTEFGCAIFNTNQNPFRDLPKLETVLNKQSVAPFWDRFTWFHVDDPDRCDRSTIEGQQKAAMRELPSDFSNLKLTHCIYSDENTRFDKKAEYTVEQVIDYITIEMIRRQVDCFKQQYNNAKDSDKESIKLIAEEYLTIHKPIARSREHIFIKDQYKLDIISKGLQNTSPYVVRYEGPNKCGKTFSINTLVEIARQSFAFEVIHLSDIKNFQPRDKITVYVFDDCLLTRNDQARYINIFNAQELPHLFIIISNNQTKCFYHPFRDYYLDVEGDMNALVRRIGLSGRVKTKDDLHDLDQERSSCLSFNHSNVVYTSDKDRYKIPKCDVAQFAFSKFRDYLKQVSKITEVYQTPPPFDYDLILEADSFDEFFAAIASRRRLTAAAIRKTNGVTITVGDRLQNMSIPLSAGLTMPQVSDMASFVRLAKSVMSTARANFPAISFKIQIGDNNTYALVGDKLYIVDGTPETSITYTSNSILFTNAFVTKEYTPTQLIDIIANRKFDEIGFEDQIIVREQLRRNPEAKELVQNINYEEAANGIREAARLRVPPSTDYSWPILTGLAACVGVGVAIWYVLKPKKTAEAKDVISKYFATQEEYDRFVKDIRRIEAAEDGGQRDRELLFNEARVNPHLKSAWTAYDRGTHDRNREEEEYYDKDVQKADRNYARAGKRDREFNHRGSRWADEVEEEYESRAYSEAYLKVMTQAVKNPELKESLDVLLKGNKLHRSLNTITHVSESLVQDHHHKDLPATGIAKHYHECEVCKQLFHHTHVKRTYEASLKYGKHLCMKCRKAAVEELTGKSLHYTPMVNSNTSEDVSLISTIEKNMVKLDTVYGLMLYGKVGVTVAHAFQYSPCKTVSFDQGTSYKTYNIKPIAVLEDQELAFFEITDKQAPAFPNITHRFIDQEFVSGKMNTTYVLANKRSTIAVPGQSVYKPTIYVRENNAAMVKIMESEGRSRESTKIEQIKFVAQDFSQLNKFFLEGHCGCPVIANVQGKAFIQSLANGSTNEHAFSSLITTQMIAGFWANFPDYQLNNLTTKSYEGVYNPDITIDDPLLGKCAVSSLLKIATECCEPSSREMTNGIMYGDNICCKPFNKSSQGDYGIKLTHPKLTHQSTAAPAAMSDKDVSDRSSLYIDPKTKLADISWTNIRHITEKSPNLSFPHPDTISKTKSILCEYMRANFAPLKDLKLSETINGYYQPNHPYNGCLPGLKMISGAGPVAKYIMGKTLKGDFFVNNSKSSQPFYVFGPDPASDHLRAQHESDIKTMEDHPTMFDTEFHKKRELRPQSKVDKGSTRLFAVLGMRGVLMMRHSLGHFIAQNYKKRNELTSQLGINTYLEFTELRKRMDKLPDSLFHELFLDFEKYDKSVVDLFFQLLAYALSTISNHSEKYFLNLFRSVTRGVGFCEGTLFRILDSVFSGLPGTTVIDDMVNLIAAILIFVIRGLELQKPPGFFTLRTFSSSISLITYGDDNWSKWLKELFPSVDSITAYYKMVGLKATPSGKGNAEEDETFMSRKTTLTPNFRFVKPALKKSSIIRTVQWVPNLDEEMVAANWSAALFEASMWGEEFFNDMVSDMRLLAKKYKFNNIFSKVTCTSYLVVSEQLEQYIRFKGKHPMGFTPPLGDSEHLKFCSKSKILNFTSKMNTTTTTTKTPNYVGEWNELRQTDRFKYAKATDTYVKSGQDHTPSFTCYVTYVCGSTTESFTGIGTTKKDAKQEAFRSLVTYLNFVSPPPPIPISFVTTETPQSVTSEGLQSPGPSSSDGPLSHAFNKYVNGELPINVFLSLVHKHFPALLPHKATSDLARIHHLLGVRSVPMNGFRNQLRFILDNFETWRAIPEVVMAIDVLILTIMTPVKININPRPIAKPKSRIRKDLEYITSRMQNIHYNDSSDDDFVELTSKSALGSASTDAGVHPIQSSGASASAGGPVDRGLAPSGMTEGAVDRPVDPQTVASYVNDAQRPGFVQMFGPPPMEDFNVNTKDLIDHAYQPLDCNITLELSGDMPVGKPVVIIPYGPNKYLSRPASAWLNLHQYFRGGFEYTIHQAAVPMIKGEIIWGWMRRTPLPTDTIDIDEVQKIDWNTDSVVGTNVFKHVLYDARRNDFYRRVKDFPGNAAFQADLPCIVGVVHIVPENQFPEGTATITIRIRSNLATSATPYPFKAFDLDFSQLAPSRGIQGAPRVINNTSLNGALGFTTDTQAFLATDGTRTGTVDKEMNICQLNPQCESLFPNDGLQTNDRDYVAVGGSFGGTNNLTVITVHRSGPFKLKLPPVRPYDIKDYYESITEPRVGSDAAVYYFEDLGSGIDVKKYYRNATSALAVSQKRFVYLDGLIIMTRVELTGSGPAELIRVYEPLDSYEGIQPVSALTPINRRSAILPPNYKRVVISEYPLSSVATGFSADPTIPGPLTLRHALASECIEQSTPCLDLTITDVRTANTVMTLRYDSSSKDILLYTESPYGHMTYPGTTEFLKITTVTKSDMSKTLTATNTVNFLPRFAASSASDFYASFHSKAAMAGAALAQGAGSGMNALSGLITSGITWGRQKEAMNMGFTHEKQMANMGFDQQSLMQRNQFGQEHSILDKRNAFTGAQSALDRKQQLTMQGNNFQGQMNLQNNQAANSIFQQNDQQQHDTEQRALDRTVQQVMQQRLFKQQTDLSHQGFLQARSLKVAGARANNLY